MRVLIFGSSSFAARGLPQQLEACGHEVWTFDRKTISGAKHQRALSGPYTSASASVKSIGNCDAVINFAIGKFGTVEENRVLLDQVIKAAEAVKAARFIHVSSVSALLANRGVVDEHSPAVNSRWQGSYSRVKADAEAMVRERWTLSALLIIRPGFILAEGLVDTIVGIGMPLPTSQILGLGNKNTIIPLVSREAVHNAIAKLVDLPIAEIPLSTFMLVSPGAPTRREYLDYHCSELGRGTGSLYFSPLIWKWGLALVSTPFSIIKRRQFRLAKLFEHNIIIRRYDCTCTSKLLDLNLTFDWRERLRQIYRIEPTSPAVGAEETSNQLPKVEQIIYFGFGRIVKQKHLGALRRIGFNGTVFVRDPAVVELPKTTGYSLELTPDSVEGVTHAVISAPWTVRENILNELPQSVCYILMEKPFAVSREHLSRMTRLVEGRSAYVLHNYRLKENVSAFLQFRRRYQSGKLRHVTLRYETPSPFIEKSAWIRNERQNRILVTDYGLHFLDLAWMFLDGPMDIRQLRVSENVRGEIESVSAFISFGDSDCTVILRQGCHRREADIHYCFQNYDAHLRFFPDVFAATFGGHSALDDLRLAVRAIKPTIQKLADKAELTVADRSHDSILGAFLGLNNDIDIDEFSLHRLLPFYTRLTSLADVIYEQ